MDRERTINATAFTAFKATCLDLLDRLSGGSWTGWR